MLFYLCPGDVARRYFIAGSTWLGHATSLVNFVDQLGNRHEKLNRWVISELGDGSSQVFCASHPQNLGYETDRSEPEIWDILGPWFRG